MGFLKASSKHQVLKTQPLPLASAGIGRHILWMMAVKIFVALCVALISVTTFQIALDWQNKMIGRFTVVVPSDAFVDNYDKREVFANEITSRLSKIDGITDTYIPEEEKLANLLLPWVNANQSEDIVVELPPLTLPLLVDVKAEDSVAYKTVLDAISNVVEGIRLDDHGEWREKFVKSADLIQWSGIIVLCLLMAANSGLALVVARAMFEAHERSLHLLHVMGANDDWLARIFRDLALSITVRAGIIATVLYLALIILAAQTLDLELSTQAIKRLAWTSSLSAPIIVIILTVIAGQAAKFEALSQLKRWP